MCVFTPWIPGEYVVSPGYVIVILEAGKLLVVLVGAK